MDTSADSLRIEAVDWWPISGQQGQDQELAPDAGRVLIAGQRAGVQVFTSVALLLTAAAWWVAACVIVPFPS